MSFEVKPEVIIKELDQMVREGKLVKIMTNGKIGWIDSASPMPTDAIILEGQFMSFTDDDVRIFKTLIDSGKYPSQLRGLLARLDAAERVCQQVEIYITDETPMMFRTKELLAAWNKSAGKPQGEGK